MHPFRCIRVQASVWTPKSPIRPSLVLSYFLGKHVDVFDGEPFSLNLAPEAPEEIPRVILRSADGLRTLQAAKSRIDFIVGASPENQEPVMISETLRHGSALIKGYLGSVDGVAGRLAIVVTRISPEDDPAWYLSRHFCRDEILAGPINRPGEFEIHAMKRYMLNGRIEINSWMRCQSGIGRVTAQGAEQRIIIVQQDLNSVADGPGSRDYLAEDIDGFFEQTADEVEKILNLYFGLDGIAT